MSSLNDIFYDNCKNNNVEEVLKMLKENSVTDYKGGFIGFCKAGNVKMVENMIKLEARNGNQVDYDYGLRISSLKGHYELVVYLLRKKARDVNGALYHACKGGHTNICRFLMKKYKEKIINKQKVVLLAKQLGHQEIVKLLSD